MLTCGWASDVVGDVARATFTQFRKTQVQLSGIPHAQCFGEMHVADALLVKLAGCFSLGEAQKRQPRRAKGSSEQRIS